MAEKNVTTLVTTRSEAEIAADIKQRVEESFKPLVALFDEALRAGFLVQWDSVQPNAFGKHDVVGLRLVKHF